MDWMFICLALVPMVFCPRFIFNGFALPQTLAVSLLSTASLIVGMWKGNIYLSLPTYLIFTFLGYIFLIALRTHPIHNAKKELGLQIPLLILPLILTAYVTTQAIKIFIISSSVACALICIYGVLQTRNIDPFFPNKIKQGGPVDNAIGTIGNPNFLSSYLSGTFWLTVYAGIAYHEIFFLISIIILYTLYKTNSRAGQVAIIFSLIFLILYCSNQNWLPYSDLIFYLCLGFIVFTLISIPIFICKKWDIFWHSKIDPDAKKRVWFASFRYRLCYWLVALHLIKKKWLFGWGLWSYRKECYQGQAELNDKYSDFMDRERYITPQPRECHNDWLEHIFEYGIVGAGLFFAFVGMIIFGSFKIIDNSILNLILLTNLISILINALFFFALRIPSTAIQFWITLTFLLSLSGIGKSYYFSTPWILTICTMILCSLFLWECTIKRMITSRYFMLSMRSKHVMEKYGLLCKAMFYSPEDTVLRTHAVIITADHDPTVATIHAMKAMQHYDGQITQWAIYHNFALAWLKGYNSFFDIMTYYLKQGHYLLNYFNPINQLLSGRGSISLKSQFIEGAKMRVIDETQLWKIRAHIEKMESLQKDIIILNQNIENFKLQTKELQTRFELNKANIENMVLYEKKRMNIPDDWFFDAEEGIFKDPSILSEEERKKLGMEG